MKRTFRRILAALPILFGFALFTASAYAQSTFVYTDDNNLGPNTVSAFSVGPGGTLMMVPGSPFPTEGTGSGVGSFASHRVTARIRRNILYASNSGSNDISAFKIDTTTGGLTPVPSSPFPTGGSGTSGISLAVTPNGRFLYAGNFDSSDISAFQIGSNGALTPIGSPVPVGDSPDGIKVSPNGKFLGVAAFFSNSVAMFTINASTGALTSVGSFPQGGPGTNAADVDITCNSKLLFCPHDNSGSTTVSVARIASNGALSPITGSPFTFASGDNSNVAVLSPDNQHLFVSNQFSNGFEGTITSLDVASGGGLTLETGSPFANSGGFVPSGMGTNREGTLLYVANANNVVTGFHINRDGGLSPVMGSPFPTGASGLKSLTVFPVKPVEGEGDESGNDGHKGHFRFEAERECEASSEMEFEERDTGKGMKGMKAMKGSVDAYTVVGNTATITGSGTLLDGTPVHYTAVVLGNAPVIGANHFAISWITATGSVFQTSGALMDGYIVVHP